MGSYRIVLADDHVMFRRGVKRILEEKRNLEVAAEVDDGLELLDVLKREKLDMVILDISMPNLRGIEAAVQIKKMYPRVKILILSMHSDKEYLYHSLTAGADGYLLKEDADTELFSAIEEIRKGNVFISPILSKELTRDMVQALRTDLPIPADPLTPREREVLKLIAEGNSSKEIAALLFISARTVEQHRANIMKKLDIKSIPDLVKYAIRKGYTTLS